MNEDRKENAEVLDVLIEAMRQEMLEEFDRRLLLREFFVIKSPPEFKIKIERVPWWKKLKEKAWEWFQNRCGDCCPMCGNPWEGDWYV